jgi:hypothetical protein
VCDPEERANKKKQVQKHKKLKMVKNDQKLKFNGLIILDIEIIMGKF